MRKIIFFKNASGKSPVKEFLVSLQSKEKQKVMWVLSLIRDIPHVPKEYFKKLENSDDIWEVRAKHGSKAFRLLGFIDDGNLVILTNGFVKKSQKTPAQEIALAEQRKKAYLEGK